jgi:hypothetical protein
MNRKPYVKPFKSALSRPNPKAKRNPTKESQRRRNTPSLEVRKSIIPWFKLDNPHITEKTAEALLLALRELYSQHPNDYHITKKTAEALLLALRELYSQHPNLAGSNKPVITIISIIGLTQSGQPDDVLLFLRPMYRIFLHPHDDKRRMEDIVSTNQDFFSGTIIIRPTTYSHNSVLTTGTSMQLQ